MYTMNIYNCQPKLLCPYVPTMSRSADFPATGYRSENAVKTAEALLVTR